MIRDKLKDQAYFDKYLQDQNARIDKFRAMANEAEKSKGPSDPSTQKAFTTVLSMVLDKLYASYSSGMHIKEVKKIFTEAAVTSFKVTSCTYSQLLDIITLAILLKPEAPLRTKIVLMIRRAGRDDILLDGLCSYVAGNGFAYTAKNFEFKDIYKSLPAILKEVDKIKQIDLLVKYVKNNWYTSNKNSSWYDSDKSKENTYVGYWCFEGLALAVALGLDTSRLKGLDYIPDDLI